MAERLSLAVSPLLARLLVQIFGERLRQPVGQGFGYDRVVVVMLLLKSFAHRSEADAAGDRECATVIRQAGRLRRDEIGQGLIKLALRLRRLLAECTVRRPDPRPRFV